MEPSIYDFPSQDALARALKLDPGHLRRLRTAFFKRAATGAEAFTSLEPAVAAALQPIRFPELDLVERQDSDTDRVTKWVLRTNSGRAIETVLMRIASGRVSLCVSSQTGCAVGCRFCATGLLRPVDNLTAEEILAQVQTANRLVRAEGKRVRNVVFMGMGEPLLNEPAVHAAIAGLLHPRMFGLSPKHVSVSTIGIPDAMRRLVAAHPSVGLAVSLHAARQTVRESLIPIAKAYPTDALRRAVMDVCQQTDRPVLVEYLLLDAVNDTSADLDALMAWLKGLRVHVNLIPLNQSPANAATRMELRPARPERVRAFSESLRAEGHPATIRYSQGRDIGAACGQLIAAIPAEEHSHSYFV